MLPFHRAEIMSSIARLSDHVRRLGQSFRFKLKMVMLLPLLVTWAAVFYTTTVMLERQQDFVGQQQVSAARLYADEINENIKDRLAVLESVASDLNDAQVSSANAAADILTQRPALKPLFPAGVVIYDRAGTALGDYPLVPGRAGNNFADRDYLQRLYATGKSTVSQTFKGLRKNMQIAMCAPITGADQQVRGALCGLTDMQKPNFLGRLTDPQFMGNNEFFLLSPADYTIIASTDTSRVMSKLPDTRLVQQLLAGSRKALVASNTAGEKKLYANAPVKSTGWVLVLALHTDIAFAPIRTTQRELITAALVTSLLVVLLSIFLARRMLQPLQKAGEKMNAMSSGLQELQSVEEKGDTEIRTLLISFNRLSDCMSSQQAQLEIERNALLLAQDDLSQLNRALEAKVAARLEDISKLNTLLKEVVDCLPLGITVYDQTGRVVLRNNMLSVLLNLPPALTDKAELYLADIVRHNHAQGAYQESAFMTNDKGVDPDPSYETVLAYFLDALTLRLTLEFEILRSDGGSHDVRVLPLINGWTLATYNDTTRHKLATRAIQEGKALAEAAARAKSDFIANMSHEIRTPMNAILGLSYLLQQAPLPDEAQQMVGKIRGAGRLLLNNLNDVLDFAKIESGKLEIQVTPFHLEDVLNNLATIMSANAQSKDLELIIAGVPRGARQLSGDSLRLEQVLINLTGNAIKFTEHGYVAVNIRKEQENAETLTLRFAVRDSGIGIALDKQKLIFAEFSQADGSTSRQYGGTGLGLAISQRLVAAMGGELQVTSVPGEGSEFWFSLCFQHSPDIWLAAPELANLQVLIADDNEMAREALTAITQDLGWRAAALISGDELLARVEMQRQRNEIPAVLLVDYKMPGKNGLEVAHAVRHNLHNHSDAIVLLVTAYNNKELQSHPNARLVDAILSKPVTSSALYDAVARTLRARQGGAAPTRQAQPLRLQGLRLLVVDDSEINCEVAQSIFQGEGAQVSLAADGQQALDWLTTHGNTVDIVLMDVQMPVMNGYEATRQIRQIPALIDLPVVALTAGAFMEQQEMARQSGMTSFIAKPFDVAKAIALILKLTGHAPLATAITPEAADLPSTGTAEDLPGLAVAKALLIWREVAHYQKFLRKFADENDNVVCHLREATSSAAQEIIHKLRGAAANLGLDEVAATAQTLEQLLKQNEDPKPALTDLQKAMTTALDSIARYAPPVPTLLDTNHDNTEARPWLPRLLVAWQSDSSSAVAEVLADMAPVLSAPSRGLLQAALDNYDFKAGAAATEVLIQTLSDRKEET
jgi:signal transduction histidine kinase/DNA-binding response OmpR family regulator/HPt (histidine-containing phosphotransfer) domain-containing protein